MNRVNEELHVSQHTRYALSLSHIVSVYHNFAYGVVRQQVSRIMHSSSPVTYLNLGNNDDRDKSLLLMEQYWVIFDIVASMFAKKMRSFFLSMCLSSGGGL
ncbi:hypothetical protein Peur_028560 [Populus x canadensis]